jgi:predicted nucleic acid-binding protein
MFVAAPALVEAYAVLTRLPPPHRLSAPDALALVDVNFMRAGKVVTLEAGSCRSLLRAAPEHGVAGGRTYDAVIAACALKAGGAALLTFNARHFSSFSRQGLEIVVPGLA